MTTMRGRGSVARLLACLLAVLAPACGSPGARVPAAAPEAQAAETVELSSGAGPSPVAVALEHSLASGGARFGGYAKLRVFVTAEGAYSGGTGEVWVLEAAPGKEFAVVAKIPQGSWPHNLSLSPDGRFVGVANRSGNQVSILDPIAMKEVVRIPVGRQPHGISWHPDSSVLFIAHERDFFIGRIDVATWKMTPLQVGVPQHVTVMRASRPNELWFTVTNANAADHLRVYDLQTNKVTNVKVFDVHDVYFTPDSSELWSSSSGFLDKPSDRMVIYDPDARKVKEEIRFPGRYPFHTMTQFRDGTFFLSDRSLMVVSSHSGPKGPSLLWIDWRARRIVGETPLGRHVFHITYDPLGERLLVTTNMDGMVNVIDVRTKQVVQKLRVPRAHGIVAVPIE